MLMHGDIDDFLWRKSSPRPGTAVRKVIDKLCEDVRATNDLASAKMLYAIATYSAFEVLNLFIRHRELFDRIAPKRNLLPCLTSIHPNTAKILTEMQRGSRLGTQTYESTFIGSNSWFTSDASANVYARAIITGIDLNQNAEPIDVQQKSWRAFDRENDIRTTVLPFPKYIEGIDAIPIPISPASVSQYWRKGKEMILEEMPSFHLRPEWKTYHRRRYKNGAKRSAIQHAIFKDILVALRTIAGVHRRARAVRPAA